MTIGILLLFVGLQLNLVESYVLTPRMTEFFSDKFSQDHATGYGPAGPIANANGYANGSSPYSQASYGSGQVSPVNRSSVQLTPSGNRVFQPPRWICWPVIFLGAVLFLNGALRR